MIRHLNMKGRYNMSVTNKVVAIVGIGSTIGQAIGEVFLKENAHLSFIDFADMEIDQLADTEIHQVLQMKHNSWNEPEKIMQEVKEFHKKVDILIVIPKVEMPKSF